MNRLIIFFFLFFSFIQNYFAQQLDWVKSFPFPNSIGIQHSITDSSGNLYTTGYFEGTVDFDPGSGTVNLTTNGNYDVFIQKLDSSGNLVWAKSFGESIYALGTSISVDASGNVYTTGYFNGTGDFDPGSGTFNLTSNGVEDVFIQKLDSSGNLVWAESFGGSLDARGTSISVDASGNVYTTGYFFGTVDFDPGSGTVNLTSNGSNDVFIQKLDSSGNFVWAKSFGGTGDDEFNPISVNGYGNVYITGGFEGTIDFDPGSGTVNLTSNGSNDVFVQKLTSSGNLVWAKSFGGSGFDGVEYITMDDSGNLYTTGNFVGIVDFDPGSGTVNLTSNGGQSAYVQKLTSSGNLVWAKSFTSKARANSISVDAFGNVYTTGYFFGTGDFDPGSGTLNLTSNGTNDVFTQKLDSSGNLVWAYSFGSIGNNAGASISVDASGNVYTTGYFVGPVDFDPGSGTVNLTSNGSRDVFMQKLNSSGNFVWAKSYIYYARISVIAKFVDGSGNVYTTGYFQGTVDFDLGSGTVNLTSNGVEDVFIQKLDSSGNLVWAKSFGGILAARGISISVDVSGNVYTAGSFEGTVDFDPGSATVNLTSNGSNDVFIQKLDSSGNFVWAKSFGGSGIDEVNYISVDGSGNVYTTGRFYGTVDLDPGPWTVNLSANFFGYDVFIQKLDSSGNFVWAKSFGGSNSNDFVKCISIDGSGNLYTTGYFEGTVDFDPGSGSVNLTSNGNYDVFIQKLDSSGNFVWAKSFGSIIDDKVNYISVDGSGNVYTTGYFGVTLDFDPGSGTVNLTPNGNRDVFIQKLDSSGNFVWAKSFGGTGFDSGNSISMDGSGNVYTTGYFEGTVDFDSGSGTLNLTSNGNRDVFIQKLTSSGNLVWAKSFGGSSTDFATSISLDGSGNVYTAGSFRSIVDFDPDSGTNNLVAGSFIDAYFIQKLANCSITGTDVQTACDNYTWINGVTYTSSNKTATQALKNAAGCDSVITLNLTITNSTTGTDVITACNSYTWINGVTYTSSNNTATQTLTNAVGCDSVVTLNLTINPSAAITSQPVNQTVFVGGNAQFQVTASGTGLTYQWQQNNGTGFTDISSFGIYSGTSTNALTITGVTAAIQQNVYRCKVSNSNGCLDTTLAAILYISLTTIDENGVVQSFKLFPNPANSQLNIETSISYSSGIIINELGQTVFQFKNEKTLDVSNLKAGNYILLIKGEHNEVLKTEKFNKY